jgi:hypothetical protein
MTFREAVWLFPLAFTLHVLEELPRFTMWAQRYASSDFTFGDYLKIHIAGIITAFIAAAVLYSYPNKILVFLFFAFMFTPAIFFNVFFHAGATVYFRAYCPGLATSLILYLPLFFIVSQRALSEDLISGKLAIVSFVIAGFFHAAEVGHNVFKAW